MKQNFRYEFENNSEYKYRKQEVIEYILNKDYGETIPYNALGKIFGYNVNDELELHKLKGIMTKIKSILIDYGYVLKTIVGVGYYILKPKQISGYCYHNYIRKTERLLNKSDRILKHIDTTELSDIRTKEYKEVTQLNKNVTDSIETTIYNSEYESNKHIYDNLDD